MTFSKARFNSCVTEAKRCMKDGIETENDRAIFWANERIKELTNRLTNQPTAQTTETCKWERVGRAVIDNPHIKWSCEFDTLIDCPTCGKRIEVV